MAKSHSSKKSDRGGNLPQRRSRGIAKSAAGTIDVREAQQIAQRALQRTGPGRRADKQLALELQSIDQSSHFTRAGWLVFQDLLARVGVRTKRPIELPLDDTPFWLRREHPFANHQSRPELPASADIIVIGAGLTGASVAYHLREAARKGKRIVVIDQGDPACEASGRNGGNFELIPENSVGIYEGLANERLAFLKRCYSAVPAEVLKAESERQASAVLGLSLRNRALFKNIVMEEGVDCDFSPRGWLYLAHTEQEEQGICEELNLAAEHGQRIEIWSRGKIGREFGFMNDFLGRFIPGDGTYHPFKYVCGVLGSALKSGVELYSRVRATSVLSFGPDRHRVITSRGDIVAGRVIVATNAFTPQLFPEMKAICARQSQIIVTEHAPDRARGRIVTTEAGPVFFNQPREGAHGGRAPVLLGGGDDRPMHNPYSRRRSPQVHARLLKLRDHFYPELANQPPSAEWVGPMGFTPDQLPCIGFLRPGVVLAAAFNGYGGSYTTSAGEAAAAMALTGITPDWIPEDVFSPRRLLHATPIFMSEQDSLWRIAASLCRQLRTVNQRISEAMSFRNGSEKISASRARGDLTRFHVSPALTVAPERLQTFSSFAEFSRAEVTEILGLMRRWDLPRGTVVFEEGSAGGTCFLVVEGTVDVSIEMRGQPRLLARLPAGSVFGQVSLIENVPRSATCIVHTHAILLEIERDPCERLLASRSRTALKFLAALSHGLISALRGADRQLMRLDSPAVTSESPEPQFADAST